MNETNEKIVEYIANKLERTEKQIELSSRTTSKLIEDVHELQLKTLNLHKRIAKLEDK